jgi:uncharacterized protein with HEPN domain
MDRIHEYISGLDFIQFKRDYKTVDAVIRNFEVIGEASKNLSKDIKDNYQMFLGKKCTDLEIEYPMSISGLTMK